MQRLLDDQPRLYASAFDVMRAACRMCKSIGLHVGSSFARQRSAKQTLRERLQPVHEWYILYMWFSTGSDDIEDSLHTALPRHSLMRSWIPKQIQSIIGRPKNTCPLEETLCRNLNRLYMDFVQHHESGNTSSRTSFVKWDFRD